MDRTLARSGAPIGSQTEASWPSSEWWRRFRSPELDRIVETALAENQNLKKAMEMLRDAEAFSEVEGARLLPFLNADLGMRQSRIPNHGVVASYNSALAGLEKTMAYINPLSLHYEFDFWGKNRAILDAALGEAAAQAAETMEVRLLLTTAVARAYFRIRALARQAETASEMSKLRRDCSRSRKRASKPVLTPPTAWPKRAPNWRPPSSAKPASGRNWTSSKICSRASWARDRTPDAALSARRR